MGTTNDGEVILEDFKEDKAEQLWKKGVSRSDSDGFYSLENSRETKFITAISSSNLEIKGKMFNSDMEANNYLVVDYLSCCFIYLYISI